MVHVLFCPVCRNLNNDDNKYIHAQMHTNKKEEMKQNIWVSCKAAIGRTEAITGSDQSLIIYLSC